MIRSIDGHHTIGQWAEEDRPREKLLLKGLDSLTNAELIAILLRTGSRNFTALDLAKDVLRCSGNDINELAHKNVAELCRINGLGKAKAVGIIAALELGRRRDSASSAFKLNVGSSQDAYDIIRPHMRDKKHEAFWMILLNRANRLMSIKMISNGGLSSTVADPKMIFKEAIDQQCSGIILAHNHPSGNMSPSNADKQLTKKLVEAGQVLEIQVLDHLIYTDHGYFSFADEGEL